MALTRCHALALSAIIRQSAALLARKGFNGRGLMRVCADQKMRIASLRRHSAGGLPAAACCISRRMSFIGSITSSMSSLNKSPINMSVRWPL